MIDNDPLWWAYLWESWGPSPERYRQLQELEDRVRAEGHVGKADAFLTERARGREAYKASLELERVFKTDGEDVAREWIVAGSGGERRDNKFTQSLNLTLNKLIKRDQNLRSRGFQRFQKSKVNAVLRDGRHPNSLRDQKSTHCWTVYVDETGRKFDPTEELDANSSQVGRVVAVAVPDDVKLADCCGFHATDRTFSEVDAVLQNILDAPVGIFGFSILDETARNRYWIGHVLHLVRWTLLQLPVPTDGGKSRVRILVEQRDDYGPQTDLKALAQALEGELAAIDPQRFQNLALEMRFMDKSHPMNGYVDVVAFTWGSSDWSNKDRLRKSQLLGHCFVKANDRSLHHLYLALTHGGPLASTDWYALCGAAANEDEGGFLRRELDRLGKAMARFPEQWGLYLLEIQLRLASKQYSLVELGWAIAWLQHYAAESQIIPSTLQLQLDSSNLALSNHRGQIQEDLLFRCLDRFQMLEDEAPQLVSEALLRMASTMTNNFEFTVLQKAVDAWLAKPVAVPGLLNYGKLQSTRGQMYAFSGDPASAVPCFHAAAASFARLSDPRQVARETRQSGIYEMIARMDSVPFGPDSGEPCGEVQAVLRAICQLFDNREPEAISRTLSASDQTKRFEHHLWLRTMNRFPKQLAGARSAYIDNQSKWMSGIDHPWPLICAYRAWMLSDAGNTEEARSLMDEAVAACLDEDHGVTLKWMALVLETLGRALGAPLASSNEAANARLRKRLQHAPWEALAEFSDEATTGRVPAARIWAHLATCLPFNFH